MGKKPQLQRRLPPWQPRTQHKEGRPMGLRAVALVLALLLALLAAPLAAEAQQAPEPLQQLRQDIHEITKEMNELKTEIIKEHAIEILLAPLEVVEAWATCLHGISAGSTTNIVRDIHSGGGY